MMVTKYKPSCPYLFYKVAGDEVSDYCEMNETICELVKGNECKIYNEFLKEEEDGRS